jgi:sugar fermentation stimulation protein A
MTGCSEPGSRVWLSPADRPNRKLKWTWEIVEVGSSSILVGINTLFPNELVREAIVDGTIDELLGYPRIRREVRYGKEGSRIDLLLERELPSVPLQPGGRRLAAGGGGTRSERAWVEVKNVTLVDGNRALFPDAVTVRGRKHLRELEGQVLAGDRGVLVFVVQRRDVSEVGPADAIDPDYGATLRHAASRGVEVLAYQATVGPEEIRIVRPLPVVLGA